MKLIIIGSKGFIGSHALTYFRAQGFNTYGCDVAVDYVDDNYFIVDATNSNYHEIFESQLFDVCINCSGAASVPDSFTNPVRDFNLNVHNVINLLDAIRKFNANCKFINLSSAAVYGNPQQIPIKETDPLKPISPYGFHKKIVEEIITYYTNFYKLKTVNLRIFSAYGPGLKKQLIWDLSQKIKHNVELELYGTGNESRDFVFIDDILQIFSLIIDKATFEAEPINIANGREIYIKDLVAMFLKTWNSNQTVQFGKQNREGDPTNWSADISALTKLGYKQNYTIKDGLIKTIEWIKENE